MSKILRAQLLALLVIVCVGWTWDERAQLSEGARFEQTHKMSKVTTDPRLDVLASQIAGRPVTVGCYKEDEPESPASEGAWGYVYMGSDYEYLDHLVCEGLVGILERTKIASWKMAVGVLVITHESYHLNLTVKDPGNEAKTECRAIKNFGNTIRLMGGNADTIGMLLPYGLAIHWRIVSLYRQYYLRGCRTPNWW